MPISYQWQQRINRWKQATGFFGGGGENQPRPKLCPACGSLVGISATRCHECGANLRFSLAALSKGLSGLFGGQAPATTAILVANILMFAATLLVSLAKSQQGLGFGILFNVDTEALYRLGMAMPFESHYFSWYRLLTATYLHGGLIHIGFNMMVLLDIGPVVEEVYGSARYFFFYTVCGLCGSLLSARFGSAPAVGASGAILGLIGILIAITYRRGGAQIQQLRGRLISWVVTIFAIGFVFRGLRTDNWGHFGGLAAGFLLGRFFADREPMNSSERNVAYALGWSALAFVVACLVMMILHISDKIVQ
ncbi:MAG TPA: rhomboid family intramembrane serine protease [Candidatus Acidoferrum sp.]